ncbi:MAG: hypothetical protein WB771_13730 [Solirubrobacterales bacterium]
MRRTLRSESLSPSLIISIVALIVALGGTAIAGGVLNKKKVKKISRNIANKQINHRAAGLTVLHAGSAGSATVADKAAIADQAGVASKAGLADRATIANTDQTWYHDSAVNNSAIPGGAIGAAVTLPPGSYVIFVKLNLASNGTAASGNCTVDTPGGGHDQVNFDLSNITPGTETEITLQATSEFGNSTSNNLLFDCDPAGLEKISIDHIRIAALQAADRVKTGF